MNKISNRILNIINLFLESSNHCNSVNDKMLSRKVDIFVPNKFNSHNIVRAPIELGRLSKSQFLKSRLLKLARFLIEF